ncbi:MAG: recombination factor protein RarA [Moraxellaceae bacterium]|nr:MAG: recombination factor protein RarA [Moraxellaceae bacterium]
MDDLFGGDSDQWQPLAARLRPTTLDQYVGQDHLFGKGKPLRKAIEGGLVHSMILWGPPGVGKTTLARLLANYISARFITLSAVLSGVKDIRAAIDEAKQVKAQGQKTILFVDEVHRFNKSQQDAFLPYVEDGTVIFVGATTENPSFELNNALLSRARVYVLKSISKDVLVDLLLSALADKDKGLGMLKVKATSDILQIIANAADGDARKALNLLEVACDLAVSELPEGVSVESVGITLDKTVLDQALSGNVRQFDKGGDMFYEQISALHKAVRGSSPDGALYWFVRMIDGGCDALYVARRVVRMASEDIGNADPKALEIALNAWDVQQRLGHPEGELAIAQAVIYMACAPKSNAVYMAFNQVKSEIKQSPSYEVPMHLRNAPTALMKAEGYGGEYRYAHDHDDAYAAGESYLPEMLHEANWYHPVPRGLEIKIGDKLRYLRQLDAEHEWQRYPANTPPSDKIGEK